MATQWDKLRSHLQTHGLTDPKWLPMFQKLKINDPDHIEEKEKKFELLSLPATASEVIYLRRALGIYDPYRDRVDEVLEEGGLEVEYWSKIFLKQFGVTTAQGLYHVPDIFYPHLVHFARSPKEQRALQRLLKVNEDEININDSFLKYIMRFKERASELLAILGELQKFKREGKSLEDEEVKTLWQSCLETLQVPTDFWLSENNYGSFIRYFESFYKFMISLPEKPKSMLDSELVAHASNSLVLKGVLIEGQSEMHVKHCVLRVPEDIGLQLPLYSQHIKYFRCNGKEEENKILLQLYNQKEDGLKRACSVGRSEKGYLSTIKCFVMPLAACFFKPIDLKLSQKAIERLDEIQTSDCKSGQGYVDFLREFGSHVCLGPFHFGGSYRWRCFSCGVNGKEFNLAKKLQDETIAFYATGPEPPPVKMNLENNSPHFTNELCRKTFLYVVSNGGPRGPLPITSWRNRLVVDKSSWAVLDCGENYYAVWDIISMNHQDDFQNHYALAKKLKEVWEQINSGKNKEYKFAREAVNMESVVRSWVKKSSESTCNKNLNTLLKARETIMKESMDPKIWPTCYLSLSQVQRYVKVAFDLCAKMSTAECENIKSIMRQIVGPVDLEAVPEFSNKEFIQKCLCESDKMYEFKDFMLHIETCFKFALESIPCGTGDNEMLLELLSNPDTSKKASDIVKNTVHYLQTHFQRSGKVYIKLFVDTLLFPFRYSTEGNQILLYLKAPSDINHLNDLFERHTKHFFCLKVDKNFAKLQAYLIQLTIEISKEMGMDIYCKKTNTHIAVIQEVLESDCHIDPNIESILTEIIGKTISIERVEMALEHIMSSANESEISNRVQLVVPQAPKAHKPQNVAVDFEIMLTVCDLKRSYPQNLTLLDALEVREGNENYAESCNDRKVYPFLIIKKIMSFDHRCFIRLSPRAIQNMLWKRRELKMAQFVSTDKGKLVADINPLDGLIMVLLCADNFLRQDLLCRLATCQNAVPLVLPDPKTGNLTLNLWAMRNIIKQWKSKAKKDKEFNVHEVPIISYPTPIVSFIRFGSHLRSKSNLINIIMNDSGHSTFFHYDCDGGFAKKILAEGVLEIAWYLPSSTSQSFRDAVTFVNLHGDARTFPKQINFLSKISFMHFVLLDEEALDMTGAKILQTLSKAAGSVVLLQNKKPLGKNVSYESAKPKFSSIIKLDEKNEADIKCHIRETIANAIAKHWDGKPPSRHSPDYEGAAHESEIYIDEENEECTEGKVLAEKFKEIVVKASGDYKNPKDQLQLQGVHLWHRIALKDKETYRQKESHGVPVAKHTVCLKKEIASVRKEQYDLVQNISKTPIVDSFVTTLYELSQKKLVRSYYLRWIKLLLDNLSREKLPPLHRQYQQKRAELQKAKASVMESCKREIEQLNTKLINASFGLEHLLREVGQIYEATIFFQSQKYLDLPSIAAEILIDGYPLELMDGDAAHVPIRWVSAVLQKVKDKLNNPSTLVLSILGVQSTGKSTLLNTVFGVNFSVSAGRCTRGAFMQLLPIYGSGKKRSYLLLVDTEGLRAPELDVTQTHNHDNQLATFVIGLANVTVINIYGEVSADMNDILQTVVHAFLRMKHVTQLYPGCHFVYQNVTGVMASDKGMMGRGKIKANLDKITQVAAKEEGLEKLYTCFSDVIQFDDEKDVSFFPSLWFGNPPMAPVNPSYSRQANILRMDLMRYANQRKRRHVIKLSEFIDYLEKFWNAILHENFIFSFRNALEISAFSTLDSQRSKWHWSFQKAMMTWEDNFETEMCNYRGSNLPGAYEKATKKLFKNAAKKYSSLNDEMHTFFEESAEREILVNWKAETERLLSNLHSELTNHAMQHCERFLRELRAQEKLVEIQRNHHSVISAKVKLLVSNLDSEKLLTETQLKEKFEEQWKDWIKGLDRMQVLKSEQRSIEMDMEHALLQHFEKKHSNTLLRKINLEEGGEPFKDLKGGFILELNEKKHVILRARSFTQSVVNMTMTLFQSKEPWRPLAERETEYYLQEVKKYLLSKQNKDYNPSFVTELLKLLQREVANFNSKNDTFEFRLSYEMDLALTSCRYALPKFKEMKVRYQAKHDPVKCLEAEKERYFHHFRDSYMRTSQEIIAARHCCEVVEDAIERRVIKSLCVTVVEKMEKDEVNSFLFTKPALIKKVLGSIGIELQKINFKTCSSYLRHPMETLQDYVKSYTETYCDNGYPCSVLTQYARGILKEVMTFVREIVDENNIKHSERFILLEWVDDFKKRASERLIIEDKIAIRGVLNSEDASHSIAFFTEELMKGFSCIEENLSKKLVLEARDMERWDQKPYDVIFDRVSGCKAACPFCREPCSKTSRDHDGDHTVKLHRPKCLGGWHKRSTGKMSLETCTEAVTNDSKFYVSPDSDETHPYRTCEVIYPKWHIQEDLPGETSLYWKYVVAHFKSELARLYRMEEEDSVPEDWMGFELSQAIEAL